MTTFSTIAAAAAHSREYDEVTYVNIDAEDFEEALDDLNEEVGLDEDSDYVENGNVLEFWAFDPGTDDDSMTMRVHVVRSS